MKRCPHCQARNYTLQSLCTACGRPLKLPPGALPMPEQTSVVLQDPDEALEADALEASGFLAGEHDTVDVEQSHPQATVPHVAVTQSAATPLGPPTLTTMPAPADGPASSLVTLPRYELLEEIGRGGMGVVHRARDRKLNRIVALKRIALPRATPADRVALLMRELRLTARLHHPGIVAIYDVGEDSLGPFVAMEHVDGQNLGERVRYQGVPRLPEFVRIAREVAQALAHAHEQGVIHRDVKPGNILLETGSDTIKLCDFGLGRAAVSLGLAGTEFARKSGRLRNADLVDPFNDRLAGTPEYLAPEIRDGESQGTVASDLYSLGATLFLLASGRSPRVVNGALVPPVLRLLLFKLLEERPDHRFESVDEFLAALDAIDPDKAPDHHRLPCPNCQAENEQGAQYCSACGERLSELCPRCTREVRTDAEYCTGCGAHLPEQRRITLKLSTARSLRATGHLARAYDELRDVLAIDPLHKPARNQLDAISQVLESSDRNLKLAREALEKRDLAFARARLDDVVKTGRQDESTRAAIDEIGRALEDAVPTVVDGVDRLMNAGAYRTAVERLRTATALSPTDRDLRHRHTVAVAAAGRQEFDRLLTSARSQVEQKQHRNALRTLATAERLWDGRHPEIAELRERALHKLHPSRSLRTFRRAAIGGIAFGAAAVLAVVVILQPFNAILNPTPTNTIKPHAPPKPRTAGEQPTRATIGEREAAAWDMAIRIDTADAYRHYLARYPEGAYIESATKNLAAFEAEENADTPNEEDVPDNTAEQPDPGESD